MSLRNPFLGLASALAIALGSSGCVHVGGCRTCGTTCDPCGYDSCSTEACGSCNTGGRVGRLHGGCRGAGCGAVGSAYHGTANKLDNLDMKLCGAFYRRSNAIPDTLPLGSTVRAWYQVMETNGEASDFILHRHDFVGETARLTPDGRDHIWEIAARMPSTPFPVIVERSENNSNPELDALRRQVVVNVLTNFGKQRRRPSDGRVQLLRRWLHGNRSVHELRPPLARSGWWQLRQQRRPGGNFGGGLGGGGFGGGGGFAEAGSKPLAPLQT
ncbi:MAG: hypothetical protein R3B90_10685 [Planctomycetaceae bacterium]